MNTNPTKAENQKERTAESVDHSADIEALLQGPHPLVALQMFIHSKARVCIGQNVLEPEIPGAPDSQLILPPELIQDYQDIMKTLSQKLKEGKSGSEWPPVDLNEPEIKAKIEKWINDVGEAIHQSTAPLTQQDRIEWQQIAEQSFDLLKGALKEQSLKKEILDFWELGPYPRAKQTVFETKIASFYNLTLKDAKKRIQELKLPGKEYNMRMAKEYVWRLWKNHLQGKMFKKAEGQMAGQVVATVISSALPFLITQLDPRKQLNPNMDATVQILALVHIGIVLKTSTQILNDYLRTKELELSHAVELDLNTRIADSLCYQEYELSNSKSLGDILTALSNGKKASTLMVEQTVREFIPPLFGIMASLLVLNFISGWIAFMGVMGIPISAFFALRNKEKIVRLNQDLNAQDKVVTNKLNFHQKTTKEMRSAANAPKHRADFEKAMNDRDSINKEQAAINILSEALGRISGVLTTLLATAGPGAYLAMSHQINPINLAAIPFIMPNLTEPIDRMVRIYFHSFPKSIHMIQDMEKILGKIEDLDLPNGEREQKRVPITELPNFDIEIRDLHFKDILRGTNLKVKQGEWIAIAGGSGAGKSTLMNQLVGLYKPEAGEITVGGKPLNDIKKYGSMSIRQVIAYCSQEPQIFPNLTVRENLTLWSAQNPTDEDIMSVLQELGLGHLSLSLNEPLTHASGGEKVRIGLARGLLRKCKILILDEPTSNLDSSLAHEIKEILKKFRADHPDTTLISVTHDEKLMEAAGYTYTVEKVTE